MKKAFIESNANSYRSTGSGEDYLLNTWQLLRESELTSAEAESLCREL